MIVITPQDDLKTDTVYKVKVKASVKDLVGHGWDQYTSVPGRQPLRFRFTTA